MIFQTSMFHVNLQGCKTEATSRIQVAQSFQMLILVIQTKKVILQQDARRQRPSGKGYLEFYIPEV